MTPPADLRDLFRRVLGYAERAGAPADLLREAKGVLFALLVDSVSLTRLEATRDAHQRLLEVERLRDRGLTIAAACARVGVGKRTFYRRRRVCQRGGTADPGDTLTSALRSWRR